MADMLHPSPSFDSFTGTRRWKFWAVAALAVMLAACGTWIAGQYQIGKLDKLINRYAEPVTDYALRAAKAHTGSLESELLEGCKQAQIGSWLQTTDALTFEDPAAGSRILIRLDPAQAYLDLNGADLAGCVSDEIENRQFDIGSMTNTWALVMFILSLGLAAWSWFGWESWRRKVRGSPVAASGELDKNPVDQPLENTQTKD